MPQVESSAIEQVHYSVQRQELSVGFRSGRMYLYFGVPQDEYFRFLASKSLGAYFNAHIRGHYKFQELKDEPEKRSA